MRWYRFKLHLLFLRLAWSDTVHDEVGDCHGTWRHLFFGLHFTWVRKHRSDK